MLIEISGDILQSESQYIAHQCNCKSTNFSGLAKAIFIKFPVSNTYQPKVDRSGGEITIKTVARIPGEITIHTDEIKNKSIINMYAQIYPGGPYSYPNGVDSEDHRLSLFKQCLENISKIENLQSIAFPHKIGCGLANGDWNKYYKLIQDFAEENPAVEVQIIEKGRFKKRPEEETLPKSKNLF